ncbi:SDR family oxidoreductase [Nostoc sp.]|uniref:SDR family oxidoreductase n=1 Tax=Nostoc sp. TaxID=1180 RepID=UPI002FF5B2D2
MNYASNCKLLKPQGFRLFLVPFNLDYKDASAQMVPLKRNGLPEDVAGAILLLASDEAKFITGAYLPVSGGIQML